jgi:hypothetical protein
LDAAWAVKLAGALVVQWDAAWVQKSGQVRAGALVAALAAASVAAWAGTSAAVSAAPLAVSSAAKSAVDSAAELVAKSV